MEEWNLQGLPKFISPDMQFKCLKLCKLGVYAVFSHESSGFWFMYLMHSDEMGTRFLYH